MSFQSLGLSAELLRAVSSQGYTAPTAIQSQAIPVILEGRDVMGIAQTGTGKTAGFALPLLQRLAARDKAGPRTARALVLTPTRELAAQVRQCIADFSLHLPIRAAVVYGGVSIRPQIAELRRGVDIVVATPGRLLDHVTQKTIDLSQVDVLVLDEADRMLDMGFIRDIRKIIAVLPKSRQNLMFSATFNKETTELANRVLRSPARVEVAGSQTTADGISQRVYPVERARKRELLSYLIGSGNWKQVLVFTRTKHAANRLATQLGKDGLSSSAIHGNKSQGARTRALQDFKNGQVRVLVATDIAARGLDIDRLPHVVNFDMPQVAEDYVHRIGRTGRAGKSGEAISLVSPEEKPLLAGIEKLLKRNIDRAPATDFPANLPAARQRDGESSEGSARTKSPRHTAQAAEGRKTGRQRNRNRRRKEGGETAGKEAARNPAAARPNQGGRARAGQGR